MAKPKILPRSPAMKKAVRAVLRKANSPMTEGEQDVIQELYEEASSSFERRFLRSIMIQIETYEPPKQSRFVPTELPEPEVVEEIPDPGPIRPKKESSMMSLDLSDATMMLQFAGTEEPKEEEVEAPVEEDTSASVPEEPSAEITVETSEEPSPTDQEVLEDVVAALSEEGTPEEQTSEDLPFVPTGLAVSTPRTPGELVFPEAEETSGSDDDWDPFAETESEKSDAPTLEVVGETPDPDETSSFGDDDWDPFAEDDTPADEPADPIDAETAADETSTTDEIEVDQTDAASDADTPSSFGDDDWDPFAEDEAEDEPVPKTEEPEPKPKHGADLSSLSEGSALFDQLGSGFSDMDD